MSSVHCESTPDPAAPEKSSLNTVDHPEGGAGTVAADALGAKPTAMTIPTASVIAAAAAVTVVRHRRGDPPAPGGSP